MESMSKNFAGLTLESHEEEPAFRTPITAFNASEQSSAGNSDGSIDIFKKIDNMFDSIRKKDNSNVLMTPCRSYSSDGNSPSFDDAVVLGSGGGSSSSAAASTGRGLGHGVFSFGGSFGAATGVDDVLCVGSGIRGSGSSYNNSENDFFLRSESPDSDAGYGTSFGSVLSPTGKQNSNTTDDSGELILRCLNLGSGENASLETAARIHRNGTAMYDASCTWSGQLPHRNMRGSVLSCKVFLGGVPWDITEAGLFNAFKHFGNIRIEWPGKDNSSPVPKGYLYVIFETEKQVEALLNACTHDFSNGGSWYFKISSRRMRNKEVQVIPWVTSDSNYVRCPSQRLDPQKTVFVGALHGMLTAQGLCTIFNDLFGGVVYAGVDTDKYKYPIGSGRVTFNNNRSFMRAVTAAFIEIRTSKFTKKVQVDPYLEDALCSACGLRQGPYFCRDEACFKYFCRSCWEVNHVELRHHKPLMRNNRTHAGGSNAGFGFGFGHGLGQGGYGHGHNYSYPLSYGGNTPFGIGCHSSRLFNN